MSGSFEDFKREVLVCGAEDLTGLWESWWQANATFPDTPLSERLAMAERAIRDLVLEGVVVSLQGQ